MKSLPNLPLQHTASLLAFIAFSFVLQLLLKCLLRAYLSHCSSMAKGKESRDIFLQSRVVKISKEGESGWTKPNWVIWNTLLYSSCFASIKGRHLYPNLVISPVNALVVSCISFLYGYQNPELFPWAHLPVVIGLRNSMSRSLQYRKKNHLILNWPIRRQGTNAKVSTPQWCVGYRLYKAKLQNTVGKEFGAARECWELIGERWGTDNESFLEVLRTVLSSFQVSFCPLSSLMGKESGNHSILGPRSWNLT